MCCMSKLCQYCMGGGGGGGGEQGVVVFLSKLTYVSCRAVASSLKVVRPNCVVITAIPTLAYLFTSSSYSY